MKKIHKKIEETIMCFLINPFIEKINEVINPNLRSLDVHINPCEPLQVLLEDPFRVVLSDLLPCHGLELENSCNNIPKEH